MTDIALDIRNLSFAYTSHWLRTSVPVLNSLSLQVYEGESFGFLGHNGAGKTTSIKCLLGLLKATAGEVRIFGKDSRDSESRRAIGFLPEQPYFYDHLTATELVEMYAGLAGVPRRDIGPAVQRALDAVHVSGRAKSPMRTLSKGLTQRVAMAQAIVATPKLLILDEPFSGLDPIGRREFRDLLTELREQGTTIFMSSHILSDVEFLCSRVSIMAKGSLRGVFSLQDLPGLASQSYELVVRASLSDHPWLGQGAELEAHEGKFLRCTFRQKAAAHEALARAVQAGLPVESFQFIQGSLEDVFLRLVQFSEAGESPATTQSEDAS